MAPPLPFSYMGKIIENEKGLTMLVSGASLVKMSLLDQQNKKNDSTDQRNKREIKKPNNTGKMENRDAL